MTLGRFNLYSRFHDHDTYLDFEIVRDVDGNKILAVTDSICRPDDQTVIHCTRHCWSNLDNISTLYIQLSEYLKGFHKKIFVEHTNLSNADTIILSIMPLGSHLHMLSYMHSDITSGSVYTYEYQLTIGRLESLRQLLYITLIGESA